eukprot:CAMPEP_0185018412 /NCGR_PEP_ID=MMETSP1103-20130426/1145_1 /TAXON_ID=36769 /ORGANISM="Paraphysomonas bandaiensis, Strain Caron Lab Isolate" /LENGTH=210 /DNA_ID=CAMNT_0027548217 /DNA_START=145 /DNA_END=777 /DNA_ORIENTATION=+
MGGKKSYVKFNVILKHREGNQIHIRENEPAVTVHVCCKEERETNSKIIHLEISDSKQFIDDRGVAYFKIRFEGVSKGYPRNAFTLGAYCPDRPDIWCAKTKKIEVRSKIPKKRDTTLSDILEPSHPTDSSAKRPKYKQDIGPDFWIQERSKIARHMQVRLDQLKWQHSKVQTKNGPMRRTDVPENSKIYGDEIIRYFVKLKEYTSKLQSP